MSPSLVALAALLVATSPWPADWDGVGFALALHDFDLARWQPHAPGYPVYVLAARCIDLVARAPAWACGATSAIGGALVVGALARCVTPDARWWSLLALASPVLVHASTHAHADALALGLTAASIATASRDAPVSHAALAGTLWSLALGARPSLGVLLATLAIAAAVRWRRRVATLAAAVAAATATTALWGAWLLRAAHGADATMAALRTQTEGHFRTWGGSAWTEPGALDRVGALARALSVGMGVDAAPAGVARAVVWCALVVVGARTLGRRAVAWVVGCVLPYTFVTLWVQNISREPRHALPPCLALMAVALVGAKTLAASRQTRVVMAGVVLLVALPAMEGAVLGRRPPPGVDVGRFVRAQGDAVLFGGRSARLAAWVGATSLPRTQIGEVDVTLERLPHLPRSVFVTDEVASLARGRGRTGPPRDFCARAPWRGGTECVRLFPYVLRARNP